MMNHTYQYMNKKIGDIKLKKESIAKQLEYCSKYSRGVKSEIPTAFELFKKGSNIKIKTPYPWLEDEIKEDNFTLEITNTTGIPLDKIKYVEIDGNIFQIIGRIKK